MEYISTVFKISALPDNLDKTMPKADLQIPLQDRYMLYTLPEIAITFKNIAQSVLRTFRDYCQIQNITRNGCLHWKSSQVQSLTVSQASPLGTFKTALIQKSAQIIQGVG